MAPSESAPRPSRTLLALFCVALLLPALASAAGSETPPAEGEAFHRTLSYVLRVEEKVVPGARSYVTEQGDVYLLVSEELPGPVLLELRSKQVSLLDGLPPERGGELRLPPRQTRKPQGQYEIRNGSPSFTVAGRRVRLEYPPPLLGLQPVAALRSYNPEYGRKAAVYRPDAAAVAKLSAVQEPVRLRVYFGTWCPTCTQTLPNLMKLMDELKGAPLQVEYFGLPPDPDPERARMNIQSVPTAIVYRKGTEIGRMTGEQWQRPELVLRKILFPVAP